MWLRGVGPFGFGPEVQGFYSPTRSVKDPPRPWLPLDTPWKAPSIFVKQAVKRAASF